MSVCRLSRREFIQALSSGIALTSLGGLGGILPGCAPEKDVRVQNAAYKFIDHLHEAEIETPRPEYVEKRIQKVNSVSGRALITHAGSRVTFRRIVVPRAARLEFGIGLPDDVWKKPGDGVLFEIVAADHHILYSRYIDPRIHPGQRDWLYESIDLSPWSGQTISISFRTCSGPQNNDWSDWGAWREPCVMVTQKRRIRPVKHKNVLFISVDTLRGDHLGCLGNKSIKTSNIDQLAGDGIRIPTAMAQANWTLPSHATLFTALYPAALSLDYGELENGPQMLTGEKTTLAEILNQEGFHTAAFVDGGYLDHRYGFDQGFDVYDDEGGGIGVINDKVIEHITNRRDAKNFIFMHVYDVHGPYEPPKPFRAWYENQRESGDPDSALAYLKELRGLEYFRLNAIQNFGQIKARYKAGVSYVDHKLGKLFQTLKDLELYDNTLVIVLSDHGESLFEHHLYIGHGATLYDPEVHIPLIMKLPKQVGKGRTVKNQIQSLDVMPTLLDVMDLPAPDHLQGRSFANLIESPQPARWDKAVAFCEASDYGAVMVRTERWKYISYPKSSLSVAVENKLKPSKQVTPDHYLVFGEQLYDLSKDPGERVNLISREKSVANELKAMQQAYENQNKTLAASFEVQRGKQIVQPQLDPHQMEKLRALGYLE